MIGPAFPADGRSSLVFNLGVLSGVFVPPVTAFCRQTENRNEERQARASVTFADVYLLQVFLLNVKVVMGSLSSISVGLGGSAASYSTRQGTTLPSSTRTSAASANAKASYSAAGSTSICTNCGSAVYTATTICPTCGSGAYQRQGTTLGSASSGSTNSGKQGTSLGSGTSTGSYNAAGSYSSYNASSGGKQGTTLGSMSSGVSNKSTNTNYYGSSNSSSASCVTC